jgi:anti-anti-sigma regulatory factor
MVDRRVMESGNPEYHILEPIRMAGGQNAWLDTNKVPIRGADGEIVGILGTYEDVTARQGEGTELRADRDRLELVVSARTAELEVTTRQLREEISRREASNAERERLQEIVGVQERAITELSTPVFPITDEILVVPLIGPIDELRAKEIMRTVLASISKHRARAVIIDIAAVLLVDGEVAGHLGKTLQAVRLKGARAIVSGISDAAAETLVELGIDWPEVLSVSDLRGGLLVALDSLGVELGGVAHPRKRG